MKRNPWCVWLPAIAVALAGMAAVADEQSDRDSRRVVRIDEHVGRIEIDLHLHELRQHMRTALDAARNALDAGHDAMDHGLRGAFAQFEAFQLAKSEAGEARPVDVRRSADGVREVRIENVAGEVIVRGWDEDVIHVEGSLGEDVEELEFDVSGRTADIDVKVPRRGAKKIRTNLTVHVPRRCSLDVETVSASIDVDGLDGETIELRSVSRDIVVRRCSGSLDLRSTSGSITVEDAQRDVEVESISGDIQVAGTPRVVDAESISGSISVSEVQQQIQAETISGRIAIRGARLAELDLEAVSGGIEYEGGLQERGEVQVSTLSGEVSLVFTESIEGEFEFQTFSGRIETDFGPDTQGAPQSIRAKELRFTLGDGDATIDIETFSGNVLLRMP